MVERSHRELDFTGSERSRVVKAGRVITVSEGEALAMEVGGERPVATMVSTLMAVVGRDGIHH